MTKKKWLLIAVVAVIGIGLVLGFSSKRETQTWSPYEELVKDGYGGTPEQLIASLVGELSTAEVEKETAFDRACLLGYTASYDVWIETLTGLQTADNARAVYEITREGGYQEDLTTWLEGLVPHPEQLGVQVTEYSLACQNGFEGSFTQWVISLIGYIED